MPKIIMKMFVERYFDYKYYDIDLEMVKIQQSYYFLASGNFCHLLLITYANRLDPDQERGNDGPDLDPNHSTP